MTLLVKLFARARDLAGSPQVSLDLPEGATVADLRRQLTMTYPALAPLAPNLLIALGTDYAHDQQPLSANSDIACFPPVSGG